MDHALTEPAGLVSLATLVRDCSASGVGRNALLLRTDLLPPALSRPHHIRLAAEALHPLRDADRAQTFELGHDRLAVAWRGDAPTLLQGALDGLRHLMLDAPQGAPTVPELARLFNLPHDGAALMAQASGPSAQQPPAPPPPKAARSKPTLPPLDLRVLELMEERLSSASVARFTRRRPVCSRTPSGAFALAWETRFLHIGELMDTLAPGRNPYADPWLFRRLTRMLDRRMLALLGMGTELQGAGPFALDLNVSGLLSPEFLRFDAALPQALRGRCIIDLHPTDVLADLPAYQFARAFARARGYHLMLRGLTATLLPALNLAGLDMDYAELRWSPSLAGLDPALLAAPRTRWLLARADDAAAVQWGLGVGITLFSGDVARPSLATPGRGR